MGPDRLRPGAPFGSREALPGAYPGPDPFLRDPPEPPRATSLCSQGALDPLWVTSGLRKDLSKCKGRHAQNLGNMSIWPPGISKNQSYAVFWASQTAFGPLKARDPVLWGRPRSPKMLPGIARGPSKWPPGPSRRGPEAPR